MPVVMRGLTELVLMAASYVDALPPFRIKVNFGSLKIADVRPCGASANKFDQGFT